MKILERLTLPPRFAKETRLLFWPWLAVVAVAAIPIWVLVSTSMAIAIWPLEQGLTVSELWNAPRYVLNKGGFALVGGAGLLLGCTLLVALSFGAEFQNRTLPLLLSQPCTRLRLWGEKMLVLAGLILLAMAAFVIGMSHDLARAIEVMRLATYTVLPLVCAAGFWTLFPRSTLGGVVFSLASLGAVMLTVVFWVEKMWAGQPIMVDGMTPLAMSVAGLAYALLFLWLSWWKFSRLELNTADGGESGLGASTGADAPVAAVLRSRVGSPVANFVRKELRLLRPLLVLALLFAASWVALTLLVVLLPRQADGADLLLGVLTAFYMALTLVLAGCLPLCEERTLGLHLANLTLPVPVRLQWRIKLLVALAVGLAAGVALPLLLSVLTAGAIESPLPRFMWGQGRFAFMDEMWRLFSRNGFNDIRLDIWIGFALLGLLVLLGFWSATWIQRVTHAILLVFFTVVALQVSCLLGTLGGNLAIFPFRFYGRFNGQHSGWLMDLVTSAMVRFQTTSAGFHRFYGILGSSALAFWPVVGVGMLVVGVQSWRAFRTPTTGWGRPLARLALSVGLAAGLSSAVRQGFYETGSYMNGSPLMRETRAAFSALKFPPAAEVQKHLPVSLAELEATGKLSAQTKAWLQNTKLEIAVINRMVLGRGSSSVIRYDLWAVVIFPNGDRPQFNIRQEIERP